MGPAKFAERTIHRLEARRKKRGLSDAERERLHGARYDLLAWERRHVRGPMSEGIIWRSKRDGGPYTLAI